MKTRVKLSALRSAQKWTAQIALQRTISIRAMGEVPLQKSSIGVFTQPQPKADIAPVTVNDRQRLQRLQPDKLKAYVAAKGVTAAAYFSRTDGQSNDMRLFPIGSCGTGT